MNTQRSMSGLPPKIEQHVRLLEEKLTRTLLPAADIISPDCRDGKCAACLGDAWDDVKDQGTECQHACHGDAS